MTCSFWPGLAKSQVGLSPLVTPRFKSW